MGLFLDKQIFPNPNLGYEFKNDACVDINECSTKTHTCVSASENCANIDGGFECNCKKGYAKNIYGVCDPAAICNAMDAVVAASNSAIAGLVFECVLGGKKAKVQTMRCLINGAFRSEFTGKAKKLVEWANSFACGGDNGGDEVTCKTLQVTPKFISKNLTGYFLVFSGISMYFQNFIEFSSAF